MDGNTRLQLDGFSRRDFLKLSGSALLSLLIPPHLGQQPAGTLTRPDLPLGRIVRNKVPLYSEPALSARQLNQFSHDTVLPITGVTVGEGEPAYNRVWYQVNGEGYVHSGNLQPVRQQINTPLTDIPSNGQLLEVSVPYTDTLWNLKKKTVGYRLYFNAVFWLYAIVADENGKIWYQIQDDRWGYYYYADSTHMRPVHPDEIAPISAELPQEAKQIEIRLKDQAVVAYEEEIPVFMTRVATGANFSSGDYRTPPGQYTTYRKRPSRHMAAGDRAAANSFDLPGVPWVTYLTDSGISFHGTYWHNDFGKPRSHGCINCLSSAAQWIYRWTMPVVPYEVDSLRVETGTQVIVL